MNYHMMNYYICHLFLKPIYSNSIYKINPYRYWVCIPKPKNIIVKLYTQLTFFYQNGKDNSI